jgi:hypothetical protein
MAEVVGRVEVEESKSKFETHKLVPFGWGLCAVDSLSLFRLAVP